ncbi:MAG: DEAD/DEAH box helicase [Bacteroidetes bacterium]|nr:DEAD/DEAH box helicase [Bacteroidota bacterium]
MSNNTEPFKSFNLSEQLHEGILSMGYKNPTPIQDSAIPIIMEGNDLIACAQTGTGKTAAFLIPIINRILTEEKRHLNTLIIAPTRELVQQIDQQIDGLGYFAGISSIAIYGGNDGIAWANQKHALDQGVDIICATPGRLIALIQTGQVKFDQFKHLVLDEADRMLDMGFLDDIHYIIKHLPKNRQTILFSATMPAKMRELATQITTNPKQINIAISKPAEGILQLAYVLHENQKSKLIKEIILNGEYNSTIIFASTKDKVKQLEQILSDTKLNLKAFHSDLEQREREDIMSAFKAKLITMLIGTDILSRGIDVDGIDLVVNYDVPPDPEDYIHRIGRTARASKTGTAITFISTKDQHKFYNIESLMGREVEKKMLPAGFETAPEYKPLENKNNFKKPFKKKFKR